MKKILFALVFALCALPLFASADVDLSGMSYDELVELNKQVTMAIMQSEDFESVTVPIGIYKVGEDIPAGKWVITALEDSIFTDINYNNELDESKNGVNGYGKFGASISLSKGESFTLTAEDGFYIEIQFNSAIFSTYTGSSNLGFKKK